MNNLWNDRYWVIDTPGMDKRHAVDLARVARQLPGVLNATPVDPDAFYVLYYDRETIEALVRVVSAALTGGQLSDEDEWAAREHLESFRDWLDATNVIGADPEAEH